MFKHHLLSRGNDDREIEERSGMAFHVCVKMFLVQFRLLFTFYQISVFNTPTGTPGDGGISKITSEVKDITKISHV